MKKQIYFHILLNLVIGIFVTFSSYANIPLINFKDHLIYFVHFLLLQFSILGFQYILSFNKYVFYIFFPPLFILLSVIAYWGYFQDVAISHSIIQVSLETKLDVALEIISLPFLLYVGLSIIILFVILRLYSKVAIGNKLYWPIFFIAICSFLSYPLVENYRHGTLKRRLPYSAYFALEDYLKKEKIEYQSIDELHNAANDSLKIVFILGESVRADHMQLNGYHRKTNPLLMDRKNIISYSKAYTPLTYTAISVPQILSSASINEDKKKPIFSLIDVLNHSEINTYWIGNQTPEKSYELFIDQSKFHQIMDPFHSELSFKKAYDEEMLSVFEKKFNSTISEFFTIHMIGSHWWYETRYPSEYRKYNPVIKSKHISSNSRNEMINSYDNTIVYLDYFINKTIKIIEKSNTNTILIYLSDHGEILGENGIWLHAQDSKESENPALLFWCSKKFKEKNIKLISSLNSNRNKKVSLDFFFHTIIDLYKIKEFEYDKNEVIYNKK